MIGEIWTYVATKPNDNLYKTRPILIIGTDGNNQLQYVDIHYVIISSSAQCGFYDLEINEKMAKTLGLKNKSVIKTTKIYTGPKSKLGVKIADLPEELKSKFIEKYNEYQQNIILNFQVSNSVEI